MNIMTSIAAVKTNSPASMGCGDEKPSTFAGSVDSAPRVANICDTSRCVQAMHARGCDTAKACKRDNVHQRDMMPKRTQNKQVHLQPR
jgi:hypothetical protein